MEGSRDRSRVTIYVSHSVNLLLFGRSGSPLRGLRMEPSPAPLRLRRKRTVIPLVRDHRRRRETGRFQLFSQAPVRLSRVRREPQRYFAAGFQHAPGFRTARRPRRARFASSLSPSPCRGVVDERKFLDRAEVQVDAAVFDPHRVSNACLCQLLPRRIDPCDAQRRDGQLDCCSRTEPHLKDAVVWRDAEQLDDPCAAGVLRAMIARPFSPRDPAAGQTFAARRAA